MKLLHICLLLLHCCVRYIFILKAYVVKLKIIYIVYLMKIQSGGGGGGAAINGSESVYENRIKIGIVRALEIQKWEVFCLKLMLLSKVSQSTVCRLVIVVMLVRFYIFFKETRGYCEENAFFGLSAEHKRQIDMLFLVIQSLYAFDLLCFVLVVL